MTPNRITKILLAVFTLIYIISPLDLMPGPIDDIVVTLLTTAASMGIKELNT